VSGLFGFLAPLALLLFPLPESYSDYLYLLGHSKFCVRAQLVAQRGAGGWVVTYHVVKLPCGTLDVYYLLSQHGWRGGEVSLSVCNREARGRIYVRRSGDSLHYDVVIDGNFEGASVEQRVKVVDSLELPH